MARRQSGILVPAEWSKGTRLSVDWKSGTGRGDLRVSEFAGSRDAMDPRSRLGDYAYQCLCRVGGILLSERSRARAEGVSERSARNRIGDTGPVVRQEEPAVLPATAACAGPSLLERAFRRRRSHGEWSGLPLP